MKKMLQHSADSDMRSVNHDACWSVRCWVPKENGVSESSFNRGERLRGCGTPLNGKIGALLVAKHSCESFERMCTMRNEESVKTDKAQKFTQFAESSWLWEFPNGVDFGVWWTESVRLDVAAKKV